MSKRARTLSLSLVLALLLLVPSAGAGAPPGVVPERQPAAMTGASDELAGAWQRAREAGSYRFVSTVEETLVPRPVPEMIGQGDTHFTLENDGAAILPDRAYMELRVADGGSRSAAVALLRDGGYLRGTELDGARKVLSAAALTYVAATTMAVLQLLRMVMIRNSRD